MQSVSSRIWTRVVVSISYDDNVYTTGTSDINIYTGTHTHTHITTYLYIHTMYTRICAHIDSIHKRKIEQIKALTLIDRLSVIWKSDLTDKIKRSVFQAAVVSRLLFGCTTRKLSKCMEKKLDSNYTIKLRAILNKS